MKTDKWPSGRAFAVMEMLLKKYRPKDILSKAHQKKKLMRLKLKNGQDPDEFGTAIVSLEIGYQNTFEGRRQDRSTCGSSWISVCDNDHQGNKKRRRQE